MSAYLVGYPVSLQLLLGLAYPRDLGVGVYNVGDSSIVHVAVAVFDYLHSSNA